MAKYLPLPDGSSLKVPDSMSLDEATAKALIKFPNLFYVSDKAQCGLEKAYTPMLLENDTYACGLNAVVAYDSRLAASKPQTGLTADVMGAKNTNKENVSKEQTIHLNEDALTINSLIPGAIFGPAAGLLIAYLIYFFTIKKWYAAAKGRKLEYWCGVAACIGISIGVQKIAVEFMYATFNPPAIIRSSEIIKGLYAIVAIPLIMLLFAFFLRTIFKDKASSTESTIKNEAHYLAALQETKENRQREGLWAIAIANNHGDNNKATAEYINTRVAEMSGKPNDDRVPEESKNKNIYYALIAIFIAGGGGAYFYSSLKDGKELSFKTCTKCGTSGKCESINHLKTLLISNDNVVIFWEDDGTQRINKRPADENEKCTIIKEKGYAFECTSLDGGTIFSTRFDGKNKLTSSSTLGFSMTCDVE